jgi:hypothetical protein
MAFYLTGALLSFSYALQAFLKDASTPKTDVFSWLVIAIATLLWPVVLPSMIRKKLMKPAASVPAEA